MTAYSLADDTTRFRPDRLLILFLFIHLITWTAAPILIRHNLPLDSIEGTIWGHQLEWGYDKNPYLNAWLTAAAVYLGGASGWMIYLFSQLSVISCFWALWQLGRQLFSNQIALIAVLLLESIQYYNLHAIDFNDNTLEIGLWSLTSYFFYQALDKPQKYLPWLFTGLFAGLGIMAKYYTFALLAAMFILMITDKQYRRLFFTLPPYLSLSILLAICLPHFIWLFHHDFITIQYVFTRTNSTPHWTNHIVYPAQFAFHQLFVFLPALGIYLCLFLGNKPRIETNKTCLSLKDRRFLYYLGVGPLLMTLMLAFIFGIKLHNGWGTPLLTFTPLLLFSFWQPRLSTRKIRVFISGIFILLYALLTAYAFSVIYMTNKSSANFPGKEIASTFTDYWQQTYHTPLSYIAGSRWIAGNIAFYSKAHPAVLITWDKKHSPWINLEDLNQKGAIFVWDFTRHKETLPETVKLAYPRLGPMMIWEFSWIHHHNGLEPIKIGVAVLPPTKTT